MSHTDSTASQPPELSLADLPLLTRHLRGGFVISSESLVGFETALCNYIRADHDDASLEQLVKVQQAGLSAESFPSVSEVVALRNPKGNPIVEIQLLVRGTDRNAVVSLDRYGRDGRAAIAFAARAPTPTNLSALEAALLAEAKHCSAWYGLVRRPIDAIGHQLSRLPTWASYLFCVGGLILLSALILISLQRSYALAKWQENAEAVLSAANAAPVDAGSISVLEAQQSIDKVLQLLERSQDVHPIRTSLLNIVVGLACGIALWWSLALFPRVVFAVGEGNRRNEQLCWLRRFVLGSVLVAGVLLPFIRSWFGF